MRSLSKVIKASCFSLSSPRVVRAWPERLMNKEEDEDGEFLDPTEARRIVAETEEMVQHLLDEARERAEKVLSEARLEAERILQEAREKSRALQEEAREKGYQEGLQAARESLREERSKLEEEIASIKESLETEKKRIIQELEPELLELATVIARRVLHAELTIAPDQIAAIARAVLERAQGTGETVLKVNSGDYDAISGLLAGEAQKGGAVRVEVDNSLPRGCLAETPFGIVDGTVEGQLQEVIGDLQEVSRTD